MDQSTPEARPALTTYEDLAKMIDHSLVRPELTEEQIAEGCALAREYGVASVTVRPGDMDFAVRAMEGSGIPVGGVAGFPHGSSTTATKLYETRDMLRRGAKEIDAVINIGRLRSRQFQHVETELQQMADACREQGAILKVVFETGYLGDDMKIIACRICARVRADFIATSTGFAPTGYTAQDVRLIRGHTNPNIRLKANGGIRNLDIALESYEAGCSRIGATATAGILDAWKARLKEMAATANPAEPSQATG
jgi:deoxyribose-phosphate aldolase